MRPRICGTITDENLAQINRAESYVDFYEVRIDLIGERWREIVRLLGKPWIARDSHSEEGETLLEASQLGASMVDVGFRFRLIPKVKESSQCIVSQHLYHSPSAATLDNWIATAVDAGADICKIVTWAGNLTDNLRVLELPRRHPEAKIISFAMGEHGSISRVLSPLMGGYLTYGYITTPSADGQLPVHIMRWMYENIRTPR